MRLKTQDPLNLHGFPKPSRSSTSSAEVTSRALHRQQLMRDQLEQREPRDRKDCSDRHPTRPVLHPVLRPVLHPDHPHKPNLKVTALTDLPAVTSVPMEVLRVRPSWCQADLGATNLRLVFVVH
ncbi:hypothetical protein DPEC_G00206540 [Dallia pectoralis]|uniref:Uncharacterized protein n=1 Tax=Dallia pectoralis TaxID=75939 RepID=A0ACC2G4X5_DALPE|nr:hypothetical protein DPEC_G00206540 [Dallia pectoralis]